MARLAAAIDRPEVVAGFLIGSQARGSAGPLSDVDVAILHAAGLTSRERLDLRLGLAAAAGAALGTTEPSATASASSITTPRRGSSSRSGP